MRQVGVVIRKLGTQAPLVVTAVIEPPDEKVDDMENYFNCRFNDIKQDFCKKFVEFRSAEWELQIMSTQR